MIHCLILIRKVPHPIAGWGIPPFYRRILNFSRAADAQDANPLLTLYFLLGFDLELLATNSSFIHQATLRLGEYSHATFKLGIC